MIKLYVLYGGDIICRDVAQLNKGLDLQGEIALANPVFLIQHPKGTLLWDSGLSDELIHEPQGIEPWIFHLRMKRRLIDQLTELGLSPRDIDYFALSHTHVDHTGNAKYFTASTLVMQEQEYALAFEAEKKPYNYVDIEALKNARVLKLSGDYDLFGDGTVQFIFTPGHTPGHQSLLLRLANRGNIVISGDITYYEQSYQLMGVPAFNTDTAQSLASIQKIQKLVQAENAELWIQHDQVQFDRLSISPSYYD